MRKNDFKYRLTSRIKKKPVRDCVSRRKIFETALRIDFDSEYIDDKGKIVGKMQYAVFDEKGKKNPLRDAFLGNTPMLDFG